MNLQDEMLRETLILGCGDIGTRIALLLQQREIRVSGLARSEVSRGRLQSFAIDALPGDLDDPASLASLPTSGKLIFYLAPPPGGGVCDTRMRHFCRALSAEKLPARIVYISTSGVYGDCGGAWVTESTPVNPQTSRAQRRVDAESVLQECGRSHGVATVILRVTGIYGPGRLPLARIRQGHPVLRDTEAPPTNRIHADDLAAICIRAAERANDGDIFNVSDGQPGTMTQYFNVVCDLLDLPRLPQVDMAEAKRVMNPMMLSYLTEARRMDNSKMLEQLAVTLKYPDLESGLHNVIAQLEQPNMGFFGSPGH